jgi:tetratricopeptide (TPR) repeat protein
MKAPLSVTVTASLLLVAGLAGSAILLHQLDHLRKGATLEEVLYVSSPKALRRLSLGYDGLLADIYWTRAVQYFGEKHHMGAARYELLAPLLRITAELDPHLIVAYEYGANFLSPKPPNGAGMPAQAAELVRFGIEHNPNDWHLYYNLGFIYYMEMQNYGAAADAFARGAQLPGAHPFLKILAGQMAEHAGDLQMARMMWSATYQTTPDKSIRANAAAHLRALQVDEDVPLLEAVVAQYKDRAGRLPGSFLDLVAAGMLRGIPSDPLGNPYKLTRDGRVEVQVPDDLPFIHRGTPPGYVAPLAPKFLPSD